MSKGPSLRDDLRFALRSVLKNPRIFAATAIALGLGIGATTATLSIVDGLFFRPLPGIDRPEQLVALYTDSLRTAEVDYGSLSYVDYQQQYSRASVFSNLAAFARWPVIVDFGDATERINGDTVSGNYFSVLGARPRIGRLLSPEDDSAGSASVAVISYRLWSSRFGGSGEVIGKTMRVNGRAVSIIGVAPEGFVGTLMDWGGRPEVWIPMAMQPQLNYGNLLQLPVAWHMAVGRLQNGVRPREAEAALQSFAPADSRVIVVPVNEARFFPGYRKRLAAFTGSLSGLAALTLMIAGFNAANLLLARLISRQREFAIKLVLGAKARQLLRQLVLENSIVALAAAAIGLTIASWTSSLLQAFPRPFKVVVDLPLEVDVRLAALVVLVTAGVIVALSVAPVIQVSHRQLWGRLKGEIAPKFKRVSLLRVCLLMQIIVGTMLAATAGLSLRSVGHLGALDPGFEPAGLWAASIDVAGLPPQRRAAFFSQLQTVLMSLPGASSATLAGETPGENRRMRKIRQPGEPTPTDAVLSYVAPGYFTTLGITVSGGTEFGASPDNATAAVIINEALARRYWQGSQAIGRRLHVDGETTDREVRAVVRFSKCSNIVAEGQLCLFLPLPQTAPQAAILFKPTADPAATISALRSEVRRLDANAAMYDAQSLSRILRNRFSGEGLLGSFSTILAGVGLVILAVGVFAVVSFTIAQTGRSIGIRLAVGATPTRIMKDFLMQTSVIAAIGIGLGLVGMVMLAPLLEGQLFEVSPRDPATLGGAAILLSITTLGACATAGRRIARIDPVVTLRVQ